MLKVLIATKMTRMFLPGSVPISCVLLFLLAVNVAVAVEQETVHLNKGVCSRTVPWRHLRVRRATIQRESGFTDEEKRAILMRHNVLRARENSSDMRRMYWDDALENLAQSYSEKCDFNHSPQSYRTDVSSFSYVGENLFAGTGPFDPVTPIQLFWEEYNNYNFSTNRCSGMCGHYTQVVWASSYALGCGFHYCPKLTGASFSQGYHVVCHYGPGGNILGERPYQKGAACSACPKETEFCVGGLCALRPLIGSTSNVKVSPSTIITLVLVLLTYLLRF